ncbi:MAG: flavin reductase family protein [Lachnospiraceae bacterium]|nr:flavin reductase family protein [Lachnospiraceae bacterium]
MRKQNWKAGNMLYPVPAVMVSCKAKNDKISGNNKNNGITGKKYKENRPNIITLAWAGTVCSDPVMLSVSVRPERYSHDIIEQSGEFVVNLVTEDLTRACDWCGVRSGKDYDKFKEMKLTEYVSDFMETPAIAESPVNIYCMVKEILRLGSHDMFLAEVVGVTVDEAYMDEKGKFDLAACKLMAYSHGEYFALGKKLGKFGYSVKKKV